jgi:pimeloyl-ACP methyl ester carboxylesterase
MQQRLPTPSEPADGAPPSAAVALDVAAKQPPPPPLTCRSCCAYDPTAEKSLRRCGCWTRASCPWRCCYVTAGAGLVLLLGFILLCITSLCCNEVSCTDNPGFEAGHAAAGVPVLFAHGFTGSTLIDGDGKLIYLSGAQAVGLETPPLGLPPQWLGDPADVSDVGSFRQATDATTVGGLLEDVRFAGCVRVAVYKRWMSWASRCMGRPYHAFVYDWRRDPVENAHKLAAAVEAVSRAHGGARVQLVGHSNGGVLSLIAMNLNASLPVHSVIYAGTPFKGGYGLLESFRDGIGVGLSNTQSIDARAALTISGNYVFAALAPEDDDDAGLYDASTNQRVRFNMSDPATYLANGWTVLRTASDPHYAALAGALARAALARRYMVVDPNRTYPPAVALVSDEFSGPSGDYWIDMASKVVDFAHPRSTESGDGTVRLSSALPPHAYLGVERVAKGIQHSYLLDDLAAVLAAMRRFTYV